MLLSARQVLLSTAQGLLSVQLLLLFGRDSPLSSGLEISSDGGELYRRMDFVSESARQILREEKNYKFISQVGRGFTDFLGVL